MSFKVEAITKPLALGEGPHWDIPSQTLYFIDIFKSSVHSYKPATKEHHSAVVGDGKKTVSLIIPVEGQNGKFLISQKNDLAVISWDGKSPTTSAPEVIATVEPKDNPNRINDGKCDSSGRLWAGTMLVKGTGPDGASFDPVGSLYSISNKVVKKHFGNISISNGLAWRSDNKKFYYIDSFKYRVDSYDFDISSGEIANEKTVFDYKTNNITGIPDGMTIDADGKLYVATFNGGQLLKIDPDTGKLLAQIKLPAHQITSAAFGGENLDELYVTTANLDPNAHHPNVKHNGENGCVFRITNLGAKGVPMSNVKL